MLFPHVNLLSLFCRRFLLPEYLPYAGIFHERGQPGLATHSSVNRVLAGNEISLFAVVYISGVFPVNLCRRELTGTRLIPALEMLFKSPETKERPVRVM